MLADSGKGLIEEETTGGKAVERERDWTRKKTDRLGIKGNRLKHTQCLLLVSLFCMFVCLFFKK